MMVLNKIKKIASGKFLNYYNLFYTNRVGHEKVYEIISRNKDLKVEDLSLKKIPQAVVIIVFNKDKTKILLNKEFRMAVNNYVYNMPAGLIEDGETIEDTARRELKEETGLDLIEVLDILPATYSSIGISNEMTRCIFCVADGEFGGNPEEDEDIESFWVTKRDVIGMLKDMNFEKYCPMAARTQMFLYLWVYGNIFKEVKK